MLALYVLDVFIVNVDVVVDRLFHQVTARQKRQRGPSRKGTRGKDQGTRGKDQGSRGKGGRRNRNGKKWGGSSLAKSSGNRRPQGRGGRKTAKHSWIPGT